RVKPCARAVRVPAQESLLAARYTARMRRMSPFVFILCLAAACGQPASPPSESRPAPAADFGALTDEFTRGVLALSPVSATQAGYHEHNGVKLDEAIDDLSAAGMEAQRRFYKDIQSRLASLSAASLDREQQADLQILRNNIGVSLLELDTIQNFRHNPTVYVE